MARENKTAKTTPCTVQIIGEFGVEWLKPEPQGRLTRRAKQEHDAIITPIACLGAPSCRDMSLACLLSLSPLFGQPALPLPKSG
jgi:hypothetical protein